MKNWIPWLLIVIAVGILASTFLLDKDEAFTLTVSSCEEAEAILNTVAGEYSEEFGVEIAQVDTGGDMAIFRESSRPEGIREVIPIAVVAGEEIRAGIFSEGPNPAKALHFARYLAAPEKGGEIIQQSGAKALAGDVWEDTPNLILYSGGVNRPAVENLLGEFRDREGIELTTVFNGCGILCAAMQTMTDSANPRFPDAYFACDLCFVPPVAEHFSEVVLLTETDIGIAVPVENPHGIKTLTDLAKPGLKVGLCNQKQSTLGYMTQGILKSTGLDASIRKNMAVEVPTADFLITQLRSGALDAAIVYRVNAELQKEHIKFIKINHKGAKAVQPFSVRSDSEKRQLAARLQDHFLAHPEVFEETGLKWRGDEGIMKSSDIEIPEWLISR